ncbi:MAG: PAS domain S-box protein [Oscillatoria sp. SIO1A7]|nr:PAS domain S-box protein [Oscillatoria sp. SIO1A7]
MPTCIWTLSIRTLIIEDSLTEAEITIRYLEQAGFAPQWCRVETEQEYLAQLVGDWDVIVSKHELPELKATRALALMRSRGLDIPFIIIKGENNVEEAVECMKQGAADYLLENKLEGLGRAIARAVELKKLKAQQMRPTAEERLQKQNQVLLKLARSKTFSSGDLDAALQEIVSAAARTLETARASIWFYRDDRKQLVCKALYQGGYSPTKLPKRDRPAAVNTAVNTKVISGNKSTRGSERDAPSWEGVGGGYCDPGKTHPNPSQEGNRYFLSQKSPKVNTAIDTTVRISLADYPAYFQALAEESTIAARDARRDPRTCEWQSYLAPFGIASILDVPVMLAGKMVAVFRCESRPERDFTLDERNFIGSLTDLVGLALEASERNRATAAVQKLNQELEDRVRERTAQLEKAFDKLQAEVAASRVIETAFQENQRFIANIADTTPNILYLYDFIRERNIYVNRQAVNFLGVSPESIQEAGCAFLANNLHPEDRPLLDYLKKRLAVAADGETVEIECRMKNALGEWRWFRSRNVVFERNKQGKPEQILGTATDISDRRRTQEALQSLVAGTASVVGEKFFPALVREIASALEVRYALVTELVGQECQKLRVISIWGNPPMAEIGEYELDNTACQIVIKEGMRYYPDKARERFPKDRNLAAMKARSYLGARLLDTSGQPIGHICVVHDETIPDGGRAKSILSIFAARAAAELERQRVETEMKRSQEALLASEERLRYLLSSSPAAIYTCKPQPDYGITFISENVVSLLGYAAAEFSVDSLFWMSHIHPEDLEQVLEKRLCLQKEKAIAQEYRFRHKDGTYRWLRDELKLVLSEHGKPGEIVGYLAEITDRKQAESELQEARDKLKAVWDAMPGFISWIDSDLRYIGVNQRLADTFNLPCEAFVGQKIGFMQTSPDFIEFISEFFASDIGQAAREITSEINDNRLTYLMVCQKYQQGTAAVLMGIDITERKEAEEALSLTQFSVDRAGDAVLWTEPNGRFIYANEAACLALGYSRPELLSMRMQQIDPNYPASSWPGHWSRLKQEGSVKAESQHRTKDGREFPVEMRMNYLEFKGREYNCIFIRDISDRKEAEALLQASVQEKEVLLKEIHHRVKNNLQVISSLLKMQSRSIQDTRIQAMFEDSQSRIHSMALIHQKLYQSQDLARINQGEYIRNLTSNLLRSYGVNPRRIKLEVNVCDVFMSIDAAIPCGLIINELVTNSLKYAFNGFATEGKIHIDLHRDAAGQFSLGVGDNGVGLPSHIDWESTQSLGLRLVRTLASQLGARVTLERNMGKVFELKFTEPKYTKRI